MADIYSLTDIFVCPSLEDNLPNTVLESIACGVPVIGSDAGGIPDMIIPGKTGWIFRAGDVSDLTRMLTMCLKDDAQLGDYSIKSRLRAINTYSLEKQALSYQALYKSILCGV